MPNQWLLLYLAIDQTKLFSYGQYLDSITDSSWAAHASNLKPGEQYVIFLEFQKPVNPSSSYVVL